MMLGAWGNPDHDDSIRVIHCAPDAGINGAAGLVRLAAAAAVALAGSGRRSGSAGEGRA
jgi:hypothetical protein